MMRRHAPRILLLVVLTLFFSIPGELSAEPNRYLAQYHKDFAQRLLAEGKTAFALEELCKSLLLNFADVNTVELIKEHMDPVPAGGNFSATQIQHVLQSAEYLQFLNRRITNVTEDNQAILEFLRKFGTDSESVTLSATGAEQEILELNSKLNGMEHSNDAEIAALPEFPEYDRILTEKKRTLMDALAAYMSVNDRLRSLKLTLARDLRIKDQQRQETARQSELNHLTERVSKKDELIKEQKISLSYLEAKLNDMETEFKSLQARLQETDKKIVALTQDLAGLALEKYEKSKQLAEKERREGELESDLQDAQGRLNLVQRIMKEKDVQIQEMQNSLAHLQGDTNHNRPVGASQMDQVKSQIGQLQTEFRSQSESGNAKIHALEEQFAALDEKYQALETLVRRKDEEIVGLKNTITVKDTAIINTHQVLTEKAEELSTMTGVADIYREKLREKTALVQQQEKELSELRRALRAQNKPNGPESGLSLNFKSFSDFPDYFAPEGIPIDPWELWSRERILVNTQRGIVNQRTETEGHE